MTYSKLMAGRESRVAIEPVALPYPEAIAFLGGSEAMFKRYLKAQWLRPKFSGNRLALYDVTELRRVWERVCAGELPDTEAAGK